MRLVCSEKRTRVSEPAVKNYGCKFRWYMGNKGNKGKSLSAANLRSSNFEILRIISMILIIAHHFGVHGGWTGVYYNTFNAMLVSFSKIGGKIGVNLFVMISGYFLINSDFKLKKLIKLILQTVFYSVIFYLAFVFKGTVEFSAMGMVESVFAIATNQYWFVTAYVLMYIASPFINKALKNSTKLQHLALLAALLLFQIVYPYIFGKGYFSNVGWFITLYAVAAYIRIYQPKILDKKYITIPVSVILFAVIAYLSVHKNINVWGLTHYACFGFCLAFFCWFKNIRIKNSRVINAVSKTVFGVYLIHDNNYVRPFLWREIFKCSFHAGLKNFPVFYIAAVAATFAGCALIDALRLLLDKVLTVSFNALFGGIKRKKIAKQASETIGEAFSD